MHLQISQVVRLATVMIPPIKCIDGNCGASIGNDLRKCRIPLDCSHCITNNESLSLTFKRKANIN